MKLRETLRFASLLVTVIPRQEEGGDIFRCVCYHDLPDVFQNSCIRMVLLSQMHLGRTQLHNYMVSFTLQAECSQIGYKNMVYRYQNWFCKKLQ